ncbi:hypothetical protein [Blastococcus sp. Marseille-P5729]|uniref:hypothetical protein n=1 Tax=Blastococcus sp. Marseille-P5729 TaxID=2086582 RepID=UPI000D100772|nr:hypothetical protein [Blastococcus sp. Marseille-P5729]
MTITDDVELTLTDGYPRGAMTAEWTVKALTNGAPCPTIEDTYVQRQDGARVPFVESPSWSCVTLMEGQEGKARMWTENGYPISDGDLIVWAPGGQPVATWVLRDR